MVQLVETVYSGLTQLCCPLVKCDVSKLLTCVVKHELYLCWSISLQNMIDRDCCARFMYRFNSEWDAAWAYLDYKDAIYLFNLQVRLLLSCHAIQQNTQHCLHSHYSQVRISGVHDAS